MNEFGRMALDHWRRWRPTEFSLITDPQEHFSTLGQQAQQQLIELTDQLAGPDPVGERYLSKVGRLNNANARAREVVLRDLVLVDPEPEAMDPQELADQRDEQIRQAEMIALVEAEQLEMDLEREREVAAARAQGLLPSQQSR